MVTMVAICCRRWPPLRLYWDGLMGLILGLVPVVVKGCIFLQVSDLSGCDELDSGGAGIPLGSTPVDSRLDAHAVPVNTYIMSKSFKLVGQLTPSTTCAQAATNWELCIICQEAKEEDLTRPLQSRRKDLGSGYSSLAANLVKFSELGQHPATLQLERLDEGRGIETAMVETMLSITSHVG